MTMQAFLLDASSPCQIGEREICRLKQLSIVKVFRMYNEEVDGNRRQFIFSVSEREITNKEIIDTLSINGKAIEGKLVYQFKLHKGDDYSHLESKGMIIGVVPDKLDRYIDLHDNQPQIIHDLCYQDGLRKSYIFVMTFPDGKQYLLQFVESKEVEHSALYEDKTYQEWLRITGECQQPLPGETVWKDMDTEFSYCSS